MFLCFYKFTTGCSLCFHSWLDFSQTQGGIPQFVWLWCVTHLLKTLLAFRSQN